MEKTYTYSQLQVWHSAKNLSQKICDHLSFYLDEDIKEVVERIKGHAKSFPLQVEEELKEEITSQTFSGSMPSQLTLKTLEGELIDAYDQSCITERQLKTTLEAINIYEHQLQRYLTNGDKDHKLIHHLYNPSHSHTV